MHNRKRKREALRGLPTNSAKWRKLRAYVLQAQPLCVHCKRHGKTVPATDVDHIDGNSHNNSLDNLQGLCRSCHSIKTADEMRGRRGAPIFDLNGEPENW